MWISGAHWRVFEEDGSERTADVCQQFLCLLCRCHHPYTSTEGFCSTGKTRTLCYYTSLVT